MIFELTIKTGNDEMQTTGDIAAALRRIAVELDTVDSGKPLGQPDACGSAVYDLNGNRVGAWRVA